jgi:polysaccharide deacetylase family protein (PEP-CTERM system associated)
MADTLSNLGAAAPAGDIATPMTGPVRCLTIDVEEYFQIEAAQGRVPREQWNNWPSRVEANVDRLLTMLSAHQVRGTFFFLGSVARAHISLARRVSDAGHEIASHGGMHHRLHRLNPESFRQDVRDSKALLEDQIGLAIVGYRAPTFSVVPATAWAIDILVETGFRYDSSIFPVLHPHYGVPSAPDRPFLVQGRIDGATILEIPPLTWTVGWRKLAVAGGGYFRLLPLWFMRRGLMQAAVRGRPAVLYFHPWEFDADMPRMPLPLIGRVRTYTGLRTAEARLKSILETPGRWARLGDLLDEFSASAAEQPVFCLK